MKPVLFIDTNAIDDRRSFTHLFGRQSELDRISRQYEIKIPKVVYDELMKHKEEEFDRQRSELLKSGVARMVGVDLSKVKALTFEDAKKIMQETIPFEICDAEPPEKFMEAYYPLAVNHQAPFSSNSDKGFKDALVVSTVLRFVSENPTCSAVHLVTEDKRLAEAFENEEAVVVHQRLGSLVQPDNDQQNASVFEPQNAKPTAEKRNLDTQTETAIEQAIKAFCESGSFLLTHSAIARLSPYKKLLSEDEKIRLLKAAATNDQISWILTDADVAEFMNPIFLELQYHLDDRQYYTYVESANLPNERLDENGNVQFSRVERQAYQSFSDNLLEHINGRSLTSSIETDADLVQSRLTDLLAASTLNPEQLSWKSISSIFITGNVYVNDSVAHRDTILNFCNLLKQSSSKKRDALMQALSSNLEMVGTTIDGSRV